MASLDEQKKAYNAIQVKQRKTLNVNPWECFIKRKIKSRYPWKELD